MGHVHDLYDFTVSAFIVCNSKVLLVHHKKLNSWVQPGGHVELDEDPDTALWRELEEETGIKKDNLELIVDYSRNLGRHDSKEIPPPQGINVHKFPNSHHKHIDLRYYLRATSSSIKLAEREHHDIKWFSIDDLDSADVFSDVKETAKDAIKLARN